jgi:5'-deoxynucleotidase YfbR-like HD superfamily hydrolase
MVFDTTIQLVLTLSRLGDIKRFNALHTTREQSVAEHSWEVTMFAFMMLEEYNIGISGIDKIQIPLQQVLLGALTHDVEELLLSDIPYYLREKLGSVEEVLNMLEKNGKEIGELGKVIEMSEQQFSLMSETEMAIVKKADRFSGVLFSYKELRDGNCDIYDILVHYIKLYQAIPLQVEKFDGIVNTIRDFVIQHPIIAHKDMISIKP